MSTAEMNKIETYVFLALGTTGPIMKREDGYEMPEITELSMTAVKRRRLILDLDTEPRVQHKFQMCFKPRAKMYQRMIEETGLTKFALDQEGEEFNQQAFTAITSFINCLERPLCLIAHDGFLFHFPILKNHFEKLNVKLASDVKCADSLLAFFDLAIIEYCEVIWQPWPGSKASEVKTDNKKDDGITDEMKLFGYKVKEKSYFNLARYPFYAPDVKPRESYALLNVYKRRVGEPNFEYITAENQCFMMMKIAQVQKGFEEYVQKNHCAFSEVPIVPSLEPTMFDEELEPIIVKKETSSSILHSVFSYLWPK